MGRVFEAADAQRRRPTSSSCRTASGSAASAERQTSLAAPIRLDERPYTVIGVMPSAFAFPDRETQAWIPAYIAPVYSEGGERISLQIFGAIARMRPGVTAAQVAAEGTARARAARDPGTTALALFGSAEPPTITAMPALEVGDRRRSPGHPRHARRRCAALRHGDCQRRLVQLARVARRRREMALRAALGAGTARLARQWLTESVVDRRRRRRPRHRRRASARRHCCRQSCPPTFPG